MSIVWRWHSITLLLTAAFTDLLAYQYGINMNFVTDRILNYHPLDSGPRSIYYYLLFIQTNNSSYFIKKLATHYMAIYDAQMPVL